MPFSVNQTETTGRRRLEVRVAVVSHDLSNNCLGRAQVIAKVVETFAEVEILGMSRNGGIWSPLADDETLAIREFETRAELTRTLARESPDLIYAVKARATSLGVAMDVRNRTGIPVLADCDDWELAFFYDDKAWWLKQCVPWVDENNFWATLRAERLVRRADGVTVASSWLQRRYGGIVVPHARDSELFAPDTHVGLDKRRELGIREDERVVLFMGSPRPHKGLSDVVSALDQLNDDRIRFVVVGAGADLPERPYLISTGNRPFREVPDFLGMADVVVLAQREGRTSVGQVPAKVFDAMAMGRPTVATAVSDLPDILAGAGVIVPPGDVAALGTAIRGLLGNPAEARRLAVRARTKFEQQYSVAAVAQSLQPLVTAVVGNHDESLREEL